MIRLAEPSDVAGLVDLVAAFHAQHVVLCPRDYHAKLDRVALGEMIADALSSQAEVVAVAVQGGMPVGYVWGCVIDRVSSALSPAARTLFLQQIVVAKDRRRSGVGTALLGFLDAVAKAIGANSVMLDCAVTNEPAQSFFEVRGFHRSTAIMRRDF